MRSCKNCSHYNESDKKTAFGAQMFYCDAHDHHHLDILIMCSDYNKADNTPVNKQWIYPWKD